MLASKLEESAAHSAPLGATCLAPQNRGLWLFQSHASNTKETEFYYQLQKHMKLHQNFQIIQNKTKVTYRYASGDKSI